MPTLEKSHVLRSLKELRDRKREASGLEEERKAQHWEKVGEAKVDLAAEYCLGLMMY